MENRITPAEIAETGSPATLTPLAKRFYARGPAEVARALLGKRVVRRTDDGLAIVRIVETEAYFAQDDPASHAFRGLKRRNRHMFGPPGIAYVYPIHSRWCFNVVTTAEAIADAVLVRAGEPLAGLEQMSARRRGETRPLWLARGPARLCEALAIGRELDGWDLTRGEQLWIADDERPATARRFEIGVSTRVGVTRAQDRELRYFVASSRFVSPHRTAKRRD